MAKLLAFMQRCFGRSPERLVPVFRVPAKDEGYPKDITPEEAEMGFQRLLIDGIGNWKEGRM